MRIRSDFPKVLGYSSVLICFICMFNYNMFHIGTLYEELQYDRKTGGLGVVVSDDVKSFKFRK